MCALPRAKTIEDYRGLLRHRPWLAISLVVCLLGLVGTPPTAVFAAKLTVFTATLDGGYGWLVVVAAVNTVASLFYYLRWIVGALRPAPSETSPALDRWSETTSYVAAAASVVVGPIADPLMAVFHGALTPM